MERKNIMEVKTLPTLKNIMHSASTIILGLVLKKTPTIQKIMVRKFLKRKSEKFPLITFIYMEVPKNERNRLNILEGHSSDYPKIYHIRGNDILVCCTTASDVTMNQSFEAVESYYLDDMKQNVLEQNVIEQNVIEQNVIEQNVLEPDNIKPDDIENIKEKDVGKITQDPDLERLVLMNKKYDNMKIQFVHEIARRKKIENQQLN